MASTKWLLLLFFCFTDVIVKADDQANDTVDNGDGIDLWSCSFFLDQYNTSLPYDYKDMSIFLDLKIIFSERKAAACYAVLFDSSLSRSQNRSVQAYEAGEALRLGWEMSKNLSADMYCQRRRANCEWNFNNALGRYFRSLDSYLTSIYDGLLEAIHEAGAKLAAREAPEQYKITCTSSNLTVLTCEILRIAKMYGENCSKTDVLLPSKCDPERWPVENVKHRDFWKSGCRWLSIPGEFNNLRKIYKFSRFLSSRLLHLISAQMLCGGAQKDSELSAALPQSIFEASFETWKQAVKVYFVTGGPKVINEAANAFEGLIWPDSQDDAKKKYDQLKRKIEEAFAPDYGMDFRYYLIFYPCKEEAFAVLKDVSTENTLIHVRRPDVNVIARRGEDPTCKGDEWKGELEKSKGAIINAYKNARGNTASYRLQQVDKLFKWRVSGGGCSVAVVAIECAYKFSWLELGWTYFKAWYADYAFESVEVRSESALSPMCADIVFVK